MIEKIKNFIILGRFNNPTGALLLAWPCTWGIAMAKPDSIYLINFSIILILGSFIMRAAGCAWNDILDRNIDKNTKRTKNRPIASGKLNIHEGIIFIFRRFHLKLLYVDRNILFLLIITRWRVKQVLIRKTILRLSIRHMII